MSVSMSLSGKAIGTLTQFIKDHIFNVWNNPELPKPDVTVGRPEISDVTPGPRLNIFLYNLILDPFLKNISRGPSRQPPIWLIAKYIMTAFDKKGESDTVESLGYLGEGIRILGSLNTIQTQNMSLPELEGNPETLNLTLEDVNVELLSRIMQGPDQRYRASVGFEIRPIMIEPPHLPSYSLLVGMDYTTTPLTIIGKEGIHVEVDSFLSLPSIKNIKPQRFELGSTIFVTGTNINDEGLSLAIGSFKIEIIDQKNDTLECSVDIPIMDENSISAGNYPLFLTQTIMGHKKRQSNMVIGSLIPKIDSVTTDSLNIVSDPITGMDYIKGDINIVGNLLGRQNDDVVAGLFRNGKTTNVITEFTLIPSLLPPPITIPQHNVVLHVQDTDRVIPDTYRLIYTVNGQQAMNSPEVRLKIP